VELDDMLAEVALVKLMWALRRTSSLEELAKLMLTPVAREVGARVLPQGVGGV